MISRFPFLQTGKVSPKRTAQETGSLDNNLTPVQEINVIDVSSFGHLFVLIIDVAPVILMVSGNIDFGVLKDRQSEENVDY